MTVRQVQLLLTFLGYNPGDCDGVDGKNTQAALRAFQQAEGLEPDGIAGQQTQARLREAVFQKQTKTGEEPAAVPPGTGTWWDGIRYFSREEPYIGCSCGRCGGFPVEPSEKLMRLADSVRAAAGRPMVPTSTVRCRAHNKAVGGVENSRHLLGKAMDFSIPGWSADRALELVRQQKAARYAYAIDGTHVHMDIA